MWLTIHLMYLVGFQNRIVVLLHWFYSYATFNRGARLITGNKDQLTPAT
jgi:NADH dehydrogenase